MLLSSNWGLLIPLNCAKKHGSISKVLFRGMVWRDQSLPFYQHLQGSLNLVNMKLEEIESMRKNVKNQTERPVEDNKRKKLTKLNWKPTS